MWLHLAYSSYFHEFVSKRYCMIRSVVQGYHIYKNVWNLSVGDELSWSCRRGDGNAEIFIYSGSVAEKHHR